MEPDVRIVAYGRPAAEALAHAVTQAKSKDPLAPVTVVVGSNLAGLTARRLLGGTRGVANVAFVTPLRLAGIIGADLLLDRQPLTNPVLGAAVRQALAGHAGPFAAVRDHASTESAVAALFAELAATSASSRRRLVDEGGFGARVAVELFDAITTHLGGFHDESELAATAADHPDLARRVRPLGHVVWHLPGNITAPSARLVGAVVRTTASTVVVGTTGDASADASTWRTLRRAGVTVQPSPADDPAHAVPAAVAIPVADHLLSASDADDEVRAVVRSVIRLAEQGVPLHRIGILHPTATPYVGMVDQHLRAAGIPGNGPSRRRLADSVPGRTLVAALSLPGERWRRDRVMALVAGAPVRHDGPLAPAAAWEAISRRAGVLGGLGDWQRKLAPLAAEEPDAVTLAAFVARLAEAVASVDGADSWRGRCDAASALLEELLGNANHRRSWPEPEQDAFDAVQGSLARLAALDAVEPTSGPSVFRRALQAELEVPEGRHGRYGLGVLSAPLAAAPGLDLDAVFVLGAAEGLCPAPRREDSLLPDAARRLTDGELELRGDRVSLQHQQFLAALAAAPPGGRYLSFPRSDLRGGRHAVPSRWFVDSASSLAGRRLTTADIADLRGDFLETLPSHAAGVLGASTHASLAERDLAAVGRWVAAGGAAVAHPAAATARRGLVAQAARRSGEFTEWDGNLSAHPPPVVHDRPWSPTRLERWASCGFRAYLTDVLELGQRDEPERIVELAPLDRGSGLHAVLERFIAAEIEAGARAPHEPWTPADRERLHRMADEVFDQLRRRGRTGRELHWRLTEADLRDALDAFLVVDAQHRAEAGVTPVAVELPFGLDDAPPVTVALPDGRTIAFRGRIDRIDRHGDRVLVSDYKSGSTKRYRGLDRDDPVRAGTLLQLGLYARAASQLLGAAEVASHYWVVNHESGTDRRFGYAWTPEHDERLVDAVTTIVGGIEAGLFPMAPGDWSIYRNTYDNCTYCPFDRVCTRDRGDQMDAKADAPELEPRRRLAGAPT